MAYNTSWTMAAMVAHTAGIPLKTVFNQDDVSTYEAGTTLPGAYSIGDILKKEEYRQYIMVGSDLTFGGRRNYFKNHGNYTEFDYYTAIEDGIIDEDYYVFWGYEDEKLFDYAKKELKEISKSDEPFNFREHKILDYENGNPLHPSDINFIRSINPAGVGLLILNIAAYLAFCWFTFLPSLIFQNHDNEIKQLTKIPNTQEIEVNPLSELDGF